MLCFRNAKAIGQLVVSEIGDPHSLSRALQYTPACNSNTIVRLRSLELLCEHANFYSISRYIGAFTESAVTFTLFVLKVRGFAGSVRRTSALQAREGH